MSTPNESHRQHAAAFTARVEGVPDGGWDSPAPVEGWVARDVVRHLVEWSPGFLQAGAEITLPAGPPVDEDPVGAWASQRDAIQALLDDPGTSELVLTNPHLGEVPVPEDSDPQTLLLAFIGRQP